MQALDKKALTRRKQRAPPSHSAVSAAAAGSNETNNDVASISTAHSDDFYHIRTIQTTTTPQSSRLKQESTQVGEEAASILASVRKSSQKPPSSAGNLLQPTSASSMSTRQDISKVLETGGSYKPTAADTDAATALLQSTRPEFRSTLTKVELTGSSNFDSHTPPLPTTTTTAHGNSFESAVTARSQRIKEQLESLSRMESIASPKLPVPATEPATSMQSKELTGSSDTPIPLLPFKQQSTEPLKPPDKSWKPVNVPARANATPLDSDEEEVMAEDMEPLAENAIIDASCFQIKQAVMLRSSASARMVQSLSSNSASSEPHVVDASGAGLGGDNETWILYVLGDQGNTSPILRYGDTICLLSSSRSHFLGVKPVELDSTVSFQAGCFRNTPGKAEQWTVLRSSTNGRPIRVGKAAMDSKATIGRRLTAPVKSGDGIVLRSCQMGGIVAMQPDGRMQLVTDSYDSDTIRHGRPEEATLLGRLQRHNKLVPSERETMHLIHANSPPLPLWALGAANDKRFYQEGAFLYLQHEVRHSRCHQDEQNSSVEDGAASTRHRMLARPKAQEELLISELLGSFMGLEGQYIRVMDGQHGADSASFRLVDTPDVTFDKGVRSMVESMLPLSTYFIGVQIFVASHVANDFGSVMHALCEKLDSYLQEHLLRIASFDLSNSGRLLRTLQVEIRPTLDCMSCLYQATRAVRNKTGGALLNALDALRLDLFHGDAVAEGVVSELLDFAATPYLDMIGRWVEFGELNDPYEEFMVRQNEAAAWENRFFIVGPHVLNRFFPTSSSIDKVLNTGRYWNVVHRLDTKVFSPVAMRLRYDSDATDVSAYVDGSYTRASEVLLHRLLLEQDLVRSLKVMKRYFLLDQGDFFVNFMDAAEDELLLGINKLSRGQIEHWFNVSVQLTEHGDDIANNRTYMGQKLQLSPSKLRCRFVSESLVDALDKILESSGGQDSRGTPLLQKYSYGDAITGLTGMDAFVISIPDIPFPASLVLNSESMSQYQLLFRHLFFAKHVERSLVGIWLDHQAMKELETSSVRAGIGQTFLLRARMLHFVQNLIYYFVVEIIDANWSELQEVISSATARKQTIDDILDVHRSFLEKTLDACLLKDRSLLQALTKVLKTCLMFGNQMNRFMESTGINEDRKKTATAKRRAIRRTLSVRANAQESISLQRLHETMADERAQRRKRVQEQRVRVKVELNSPSYRSMIARLSDDFSNDLTEFLIELRQDLRTPREMNLALRLDFNGIAAVANGLVK